MSENIVEEYSGVDGPPALSALHRKYIMADEDRTRDRSTNNAGGPRKKTTEERPFDLWLQKQLHAMYDEIAAEPLPDDLVGLISRDAASSAEKPSPPRETRNKK